MTVPPCPRCALADLVVAVSCSCGVAAHERWFCRRCGKEWTVYR